MNCMKKIYGVVLCLFLLASCNGKSQKDYLKKFTDDDNLYRLPVGGGK